MRLCFWGFHFGSKPSLLYDCAWYDFSQVRWWRCCDLWQAAYYDGSWIELGGELKEKAINELAPRLLRGEL